MNPAEQIAADRKALEKLAKADQEDQWSEISVDEPTPEDADSRHRSLVRLLKASLAGQAVLARTMLRHDEWLSRIGGLWSRLKASWPFWTPFLLRPELAPEWMRGIIKAILAAAGIDNPGP